MSPRLKTQASHLQQNEILTNISGKKSGVNKNCHEKLSQKPVVGSREGPAAPVQTNQTQYK